MNLRKKFIKIKYDLISGTSVGGIIAILLALEVPLSDVIDLFETRAGTIFKKESWYNFGSPSYSHSGITEIVKEVLSNTEMYKNSKYQDPLDMEMQDIVLPVAVMTYDILSGSVIAISNRDTVRVDNKFDTKTFKILNAVLSTSAAPTYFPVCRFEGKLSGSENITTLNCVDGGIWANDPSLYSFFLRSIANNITPNMIYNIICFGTGKAHGENQRTGVFNAIKSGTTKALRKLTNGDGSIGWIAGENSIFDVILNSSTAMIENISGLLQKRGIVRYMKVQVSLSQDIQLDDVGSIQRQKDEVERSMIEERNKDLQRQFNRAVLRTYYNGLVTGNLNEQREE